VGDRIGVGLAVVAPDWAEFGKTKPNGEDAAGLSIGCGALGRIGAGLVGVARIGVDLAKRTQISGGLADFSICCEGIGGFGVGLAGVKLPWAEFGETNPFRSKEDGSVD
jgi:hypothetical protein